MTRAGSIALGMAALIGLAVAWHVFDTGETAKAAEGEESTVTPVTAGVARAKDVPVYVGGLGTVQAYNAVTVRSRVDGQIMQVFFHEGQDVRAGDKLFLIDPRPYQAALDQALAAKARDQASLHAAQLDLERYKTLLGKGFQTRQSYDQQQATVEQDTASIAADQAQIDTAKLNLAYADIRSPIDGRTGARLVDLGNLVQASASTALVSVTQIKPIYVSFTIPETRIDEIRQDQAKEPLGVRALSADGKTVLATGKLTLIDNQIDTTTGTIRLKATFANADERLWPGEFVNARLYLSVRKDAVTVPAETVMQGSGGQYVYVIKPDHTVTRRDVKVSATQDGIAVIAEGLKAGEPVVVEGQYRLTEGARVSTGTDTPAPTPG